MGSIEVQLVAVVLAGLTFVLVTCSLSCLAARVRCERERHDLLVLTARRRLLATGAISNGPMSSETDDSEINVDVVEDE